MTSTDIFAARMQQNAAANTTTSNDGDEPPRPMFGGLGFATSSGIGSTGYNGSGLRGLGFVKATVSVMPATIETKVEEIVVVESTPAPTSSAVESVSEDSTKEEKKSKKEKKEKKDKKRKSEDSDNTRSKKSKK